MLDPRHLLLVDAAGAALSALATFFLLAGELLKTGMPLGILYAMVAVAICLVCFDIAAFNRRLNSGIALRMIACLNWSYCIGVVAALYFHRRELTSWGMVYFCSEIAVVAILAAWELKMARPAPEF